MGTGKRYSNPVRTKRIRYTSAQLLSFLSDGPFELLPAPGEGKTYLIHALVRNYIFGTIPYVNGNLLFYFLGSPTLVNLDFTVASSELNTTNSLTPVSVDDLNQPFMVINDFGLDPTNGDGSIEILIKYEVISLQS